MHHCCPDIVLTQRTGSAAGTAVAIQPLCELVKTHRNVISIAYDNSIESLDRKLSNLKMNLTRDVPDAYFTDAMRSMYETCKGLTGPGCTKRMLDTLELWLSGRPPQHGPTNSPFAAVTNSLQTKFSEAITTVANELHEDIQAVLLEMVQDIERSMQGAVSTRGQRTVRTTIGDALQRLKPEIEAIESELEAIKEQYGIVREWALVPRA